jgi:hypothetical protein
MSALSIAPTLPVLPVLPPPISAGLLAPARDPSSVARDPLVAHDPLVTRDPLAARDEALALVRDADTPLPLRAWRGRSGRRYVVSVYPLDEADDGYAGALLLAVARDADGRRHLLAARESGSTAVNGYNGQWLTAAREHGANELHVHLLAASRAARRDTLADLGI